MQVSDHFWFAEFCDRDRHILTLFQYHLLENIARNILEPIRSFLRNSFGKEIPIKIVSGVRFPSDNNRLRKQGFNPSETSDHLFGNVIKLRNPSNIRKYGKYYQFSVGAVDIMPGCGAKETWDLLLPYFSKKDSSILLPDHKIKIGQVILEKKKNYWIHISNPQNVVYQDIISDVFLKKEPFLKSMNNGLSYESVL